jgi:hypothetical protein
MNTAQNGKGDLYRPTNHVDYRANYDRIFKKMTYEKTREQMLNFLKCVVEPQGVTIAEQAESDLIWHEQAINNALEAQEELGGSLRSHIEPNEDAKIIKNLLDIMGINWDDVPEGEEQFRADENDSNNYLNEN